MLINPDVTQTLQFQIISNNSNSIIIWADWDTIDAGASWVGSGAGYEIYDHHLRSAAGRWDRNVYIDSDLAGDGIVNLLDFAVLAEPGDGNYNPEGDLVDTGFIVNFPDYSMLARKWAISAYVP